MVRANKEQSDNVVDIHIYRAKVYWISVRIESKRLIKRDCMKTVIWTTNLSTRPVRIGFGAAILSRHVIKHMFALA